MNQTTTQVWENFSHNLRGYISRRVSNADDVEDILQDTFLKIHTHIDTLRDEDRLIPWLYLITKNTVADYYRSHRTMIQLPENLVDDNPPAMEPPETTLAAGILELIDSLPEIYRQPLILSELEGMKQSEVAELMGLSLSGIKSRIQRGRRLLKQSLLDCCHFEFDRHGGIVDYYPRPDCCSRCYNTGN